MPGLFTLEVHTPYRLFFADKAQMLIARLPDGDIGICVNHIPMSAPVCTGILRIQDKDGLWREAFTTDGILEVTANKTVLLVENAQWPEEINEEAALTDRREAEEILKTRILKFETVAARAKLRQAEMRLRVHARGKG